MSRQLAESGAHVVMAVRNTKAAHDQIKKWQDEWSGRGLPLNIEVYLYSKLWNFFYLKSKAKNLFNLWKLR